MVIGSATVQAYKNVMGAHPENSIKDYLKPLRYKVTFLWILQEKSKKIKFDNDCFKNVKADELYIYYILRIDFRCGTNKL